ncbi:MAG: hypothetical protein K2K54_11470 [Lachnospiraceae bacterium]|nr:hypothetical protein [Lachnospiraceae bacterium]
MPWCPKCKNEYVEGTKECANCKVELVESLEERKSITFGESGEMERLKEFLEYNAIENAEVIFNSEDNTYELQVEKEDEKQAKKLTAVFLREEAAKEAADAETEKDDLKKSANYTIYQNNAAKAEDNKSSAFTLLLVGGVGIVVIILCMTGVISLSLSATSKYMVYGVMGALFILFLIMGVVSLRSSKIFALKAQKEDSLTEEITNWCYTDLKEDMIDRMTFDEDEETEEISEEMKYFRRTEKMKELINEKFLNLDEAYLEHILDDIYSGIFDKESREETDK